MKYKVGDKVRITKHINEHWFNVGDVVEITMVDTEDKKLPYCAIDKNGCVWWLGDSECKPIKPHGSYDIHITSNGIYTNCVYKKNGGIISKSSAKLNETDGDIFSMKEGARLCVERLEDDKKKYNGKIICVENRDSPFFTIGKIYNVVEGEFRGDCTTVWDNDELFFYDLDSINRYFRTNNDYIKFIELVED